MRLRNYDYASQKVYFITLCTQNRERILSEIVGRGLDPSVRAEVTLMPYGSIAENDLVLCHNAGSSAYLIGAGLPGGCCGGVKTPPYSVNHYRAI